MQSESVIAVQSMQERHASLPFLLNCVCELTFFLRNRHIGHWTKGPKRTLAAFAVAAALDESVGA